MGKIGEVFDIKQHSLKYGEETELEKRVAAIEKRFAEIYEREYITDNGKQSLWFKTPQGTRFMVNGIYEWNSVFLEYDDGEDGDTVPLEGFDEERMFKELQDEILVEELDEERFSENAFRIYKTENSEHGMLIRFRFWGTEEEVNQLYSKKRIVIDGKQYSYERSSDSIQAVIVKTKIDCDLYDHWIQFI